LIGEAVDEDLRKFLAGVLKISPKDVDGDLSRSSVQGWDSLFHMDLIVSIEGKYGINLTLEEVMSMSSVAEIENVLELRGCLDL
jgi:acyl carrier protein